MAEGTKLAVHEGAEFRYTVKLFRVRIGWRSRIIDYRPPERFVDIQLKGPYAYWHHLHTFEAVPGGTLMKDEVIYRPPLIALPLHGVIIKRRLEDIFSYRAVRVWERAWGEMKPKQRGEKK
jgi:ligand-binding SRPBCC domain-containing protein